MLYSNLQENLGIACGVITRFTGSRIYVKDSYDGEENSTSTAKQYYLKINKEQEQVYIEKQKQKDLLKKKKKKEGFPDVD